METEKINQELQLEHYRGTIQVVRELGFIAIKALITLNSGAFVVLLTFIGNTAAQSKFVVPLGHLKIAMFCFLGGLASTFLSIALTYIIAQVSESDRRTDHWSEKYFIPLAVLFPAIAFVIFVLGVVVVVLGVQLE